ncbi:Hypothetical protein A7982_04195 [Minicystis rosea]|nr:Hypothetical protein A7982_04195 [Minicystis rosea]
MVRGTVIDAACPRCGLPINASIVPAQIEIDCRNGCFRYHFHRDPATGELHHGHFLQGQPTY